VRHQARTLSDLQRQALPAAITYVDPQGQDANAPVLAAALKAGTAWIGSRFSSKYLQDLEKQLIMAGLETKLQPAQFVMIRIAICVGLPLLFSIPLHGLPVRMLAQSVALGWVVPRFWLKRKIAERQHKILKALPDTIDLLTVSVEAGLGFDAAASKIGEKVTGPLGDEFRQYLRLVRMGTVRREAMRELGDRSGVSDLHTFATGLIQADQLGVSMSKVLRVQSEEMRRRRRQRAEEKAMKAPIKMLFPLVFFIFPTIFIVLLGPAVIQLISVFADMRK
jgi:tight adherence protein C